MSSQQRTPSSNIDPAILSDTGGRSSRAKINTREELIIFQVLVSREEMYHGKKGVVKFYQDAARAVSQEIGRNYSGQAMREKVKKVTEERRQALSREETGRGAEDDDHYQPIDRWIEVEDSWVEREQEEVANAAKKKAELEQAVTARDDMRLTMGMKRSNAVEPDTASKRLFGHRPGPSLDMDELDFLDEQTLDISSEDGTSNSSPTTAAAAITPRDINRYASSSSNNNRFMGSSNSNGIRKSSNNKNNNTGNGTSSTRKGYRSGPRAGPVDAPANQQSGFEALLAEAKKISSGFERHTAAPRTQSGMPSEVRFLMDENYRLKAELDEANAKKSNLRDENARMREMIRQLTRHIEGDKEEGDI